MGHPAIRQGQDLACGIVISHSKEASVAGRAQIQFAGAMVRKNAVYKSKEVMFELKLIVQRSTQSSTIPFFFQFNFLGTLKKTEKLSGLATS